MKIFLDSAILDEIKHAYSLGIVDGITTNPSLIKQAVNELKKQGKNIDMESYIQQILRTAKATPVSLEVTESTYEGMIAEAKTLFEKFDHIANNVCIKIPVNPAFGSFKNDFDGILAVKQISSMGIPVNCTLIFTPEQALLAAKAGAAYVSPFAGRIDDALRESTGKKFNKSDYYPAEGTTKDSAVLNDNGIVSGIDLISQTVHLFRQHRIDSKVIAASIRNARQARECALVGADIATLPFSVIKEMLSHPKTQEGMDKFVKDVVPEYRELMG